MDSPRTELVMSARKTPQPARHPNPTARASELAYVVFERPDLDRAEAFRRSAEPTQEPDLDLDKVLTLVRIFG
jgi:hypothetical protein